MSSDASVTASVTASTETKVEEKVEEPVTMKDPRKVQAGKRLAAISKAAKEKKMREKIKSEMSSSSWFSTTPYKWIIAGGSIIIFGTYFTMRIFSPTPSVPSVPSVPSKPVEKPKPEPKSEPRKPEPKEPEKKFENLG